MWTMLDALNTHQWISILPVLIDEYNYRPHSSLTVSMTPAQASKKEYSELVVSSLWNQQMERKKNSLYGPKKESLPPRPKFQVGDRVRISRVKGAFYDKNWSNEVPVFTVKEIKMTDAVTYVLIDDNGETIEGSFYEQELLKTELEPKRLIEEVVQVDKNASVGLADRSLLIRNVSAPSSSGLGYPKIRTHGYHWVIFKGCHK